jgi:hypothetical protein
MNIKTLQIIKNELTQSKSISESNIEYILMDQNINMSDKVSKVSEELDKLVISSLKIEFWEEFVKNNIIIPSGE